MEESETACREDSGQGKDGSTTEGNDPWHHPFLPRPPRDLDINDHIKTAKKWMNETQDLLTTSRATNTIIPDRTPQSVNDAFFHKLPLLGPILDKDSVRQFLTLFRHKGGGLAYGFIITPLAFNHMIVQNALRCVKVCLEGNAPELIGNRANPNYMNPFGYFPLHQAAELFDVAMIKLLFRHGASANLRTVGPEVIEDLLPLHVAVENASRHKFLSDNLSPDHDHHDYIYKLIQLLCLPEMKISLDTTRLIAEKTDNLLAELCKYMDDGKLVETAVLILAAQKQIRVGGSSLNKNGDRLPDGFTAISKHVWDHAVALESNVTQNKKERKQLEAKKKLNRAAVLLVYVVSEAGEALEAYIRAHPEVHRLNLQVPHAEVLEHVSSILKNHGFCPTGEHIDTGNLCPFDGGLSKLSDQDLPAIHCTDETAAARKKQPRGWELRYARSSFFPYWKSVLSAKLPEAEFKTLHFRNIGELERDMVNGSIPIQTRNRPLLARIPGLARNCRQYRRMFGTAALAVMKMLRNA